MTDQQPQAGSRRARTPLFSAAALCGALVALATPGQSQETAPTASAEPEAVFESLDVSLEGKFLVGPGATWKYFPGTREPSEGLDWTRAGFETSDWQTGASPFGFGEGEFATTIEEFGTGATSVYLRYELTLEDPDVFESMEMTVLVDDAFVLYVNGIEDKRRGVGKPEQREAFDAVASRDRDLTKLPPTKVDLTGKLVAGANVIAIQAFVFPEDAAYFSATPVAIGRFAITEQSEHERYETLQQHLNENFVDDPALAVYSAYLAGRHHQRLGHLQGAAEWYDRATRIGARFDAPWKRLVECARAKSSPTEIEALLYERLEEPGVSRVARDLWAELSIEELGRSPIEVLELAPEHSNADSGTLADVLWVGRTLAKEGAIRIDCGAKQAGEIEGVAWGRDRFYREESEIRERTADDSSVGISARVRMFKDRLDAIEPAYRVPLPNGPYEVRLWFTRDTGKVQKGTAFFDVFLEGARVLSRFNAAEEPMAQRFPVTVTDGNLDLELIAQVERDEALAVATPDVLAPWLAGIEIRAIDDETFGASAADWAESTGGSQAYPLVQLARSSLSRGERDAALDVLETAEMLADFRREDRAVLAALRDASLPKVTSVAMIDDLIERRPEDCETWLSSGSVSADDPSLATYFEGRTHQVAGRFEQALGAFESLMMDAGADPLPYLRMAECLTAIELGSEAADVLDIGLESGVQPDEAYLSLWIPLQLGARGRDAWDVVRDLASYDVDEDLVVVPVSDESPQTWRFTTIEPPATIWSRESYDVSEWDQGPGMIGSGSPVASRVGSHWNTSSVFARRNFALPDASLLYPHLLVFSDDAAEVYLNGVSVSRVSVSSFSYVRMPLRGVLTHDAAIRSATTGLKAGNNTLGLYGINVSGASAVDAGVVQPIGELVWVERQLREKGAVRLNCGGPAVTTQDGKEWSKDRFYGWGLPGEIEDEQQPLEIIGTPDAALFETNRWFHPDVSETWYQIPVPNGRYRVRLHFAEIGKDELEAGKRVFDVTVEGDTVLERYDPVERVGYATVDVHEFEAEVRDGWLDLRANDSKLKSFFSAIEVEKL